ncbi:hypothetical protein [Streptomyces sp. NPDC089919]|uniref:hypothetical protein n=1 Tax=Streptomyces sp. NPDC089919 TaxID=3155188 RepID=UPI0034447E7D
MSGGVKKSGADPCRDLVRRLVLATITSWAVGLPVPLEHRLEAARERDDPGWFASRIEEFLGA